ncbi:Lrp/AsnC family transcriptional regulator, partial [Candidatus Woesearchaeota archaeon]|nr:Lrp/AsnC family transcriptional regulator [Candidatus Woesearchaeota archaeon]
MKQILDKLDKKILYALSDNARMADSAIARKVKTSKQVVNYRIRRLERLNVITGYKAKISSALFGFTTYGVYLRLKDVSKDNESSILGELKKDPFVKWIVTCTGRWDIIFSISAKNTYQFNEILAGIMNKVETFVQDYETS